MNGSSGGPVANGTVEHPGAAQSPARTGASGSDGRPGRNGTPEPSRPADTPAHAGASGAPAGSGPNGAPDCPEVPVVPAASGAPARSGVEGSAAWSGANGSSGPSSSGAGAAGARAVARPFRILAPDTERPTNVPGDRQRPASGGETDGAARRTPASQRFPNLRIGRTAEPVDPPPPAPSARFPDAPPTAGVPARGADADAVPPPGTPLPTDGIVETTAPVGHRHDENRPAAPTRPVVTFAEPDTRALDTERPRLLGIRVRPRAAAAAACLVLGLGLIGGAVAGSWLTGDDAGGGARGGFTIAGSLWHSVPVDQLFPPTVAGPGAGPGGSDRVWTRIAVAPDSGCADAFDPLLRKALTPVGCLRLLRATYTDATRSDVTTVGLLFTRADAPAMTALNSRFKREGLDRRTDLMPRPYAAKGTVAEGFGDAQRASWTISVRTDMPVVVYAVSGFPDGRTVTEPQPADAAMATGATTAPAQAGLGNEAVGLADRIEGDLRTTITAATEKPS